MENIIIETVVQIFAALLLMLISLLGTWLTAKLAKRTELANIAAATDEATRVAQQTVLELQQTVVDNLKAANEDGKLTEEEIAELKAAIANGDKANINEELGDVLFSAVNVSRFVDTDAEEALTDATDKFVARFKTVEKLADERNIDMKQSDIETLDRLWDEAKQN